jgi:hypothetical protein
MGIPAEVCGAWAEANGQSSNEHRKNKTVFEAHRRNIRDWMREAERGYTVWQRGNHGETLESNTLIQDERKARSRAKVGEAKPVRLRAQEFPARPFSNRMGGQLAMSNPHLA